MRYSVSQIPVLKLYLWVHCLCETESLEWCLAHSVGVNGGWWPSLPAFQQLLIEDRTAQHFGHLYVLFPFQGQVNQWKAFYEWSVSFFTDERSKKCFSVFLWVSRGGENAILGKEEQIFIFTRELSTWVILVRIINTLQYSSPELLTFCI